jgi:tetratricopeptide (TPR) repeat protein
MAGIPGELFHRPWKDFGHNRTEALELARGRADYLLFLDADETLGASPGAAWPPWSGPAYSLEARYAELSYDRVSVVATRLPWRWVGVLHEYLEAGEPVTQPRVPGFWIDVRAEGARSKDPAKFEKDVAVLEEALVRDPGNLRYVFYLAQSYRDAGKLPLAREWYDKRAAMGGWDEEAWYSSYQGARLGEILGDTKAQVIAAYLQAHESRPGRAEPLVALARYCRSKGEFHNAYVFAAAASRIPLPPDRLFVDVSAYAWAAQDELALAAFYTGKVAEAASLWRSLLGATALPASERPRIERNLRFT